MLDQSVGQAEHFQLGCPTKNLLEKKKIPEVTEKPLIGDKTLTTTSRCHSS